MNSFTLDPYREIASTLTPTAVSQYLATEDWELESRQDRIREVWRLPGSEGGTSRGRIMLPLALDFEDFSQRFYDALHALGRINDWDADQLQERITAARADLFFVRLDQVMTDGTIPFRQAENTIKAIYKLMMSAATTAADPRHSHRGRRPATVTEFLDDDVRLGHTKRGSFVFTIAARLGAPTLSEPDASSSLQPTDPATSFARRVMETLARGLETTESLTRGEATDALQDPARWGLSAGLVESLELMTQPEGLRALDLSFEWAAAEPPPEVGSNPITLEHSTSEQLARVREHLVRQEEPTRRETLVGAVRRLSREDADSEDEEAGTVVLEAEVKGRIRKVSVPLSGQDHRWAITAYQEKVPLTVTGDLAFERGAWRLSNPNVDSSFLQYQLGRDDRPDRH
ncbi:hypothetical protein [Actinoallomurus iriomotensis]|uniref:Uncharacterized protein n=1 Tax=Actinoallomurus iriomotensis TaxID=478107 RepID=A0A9W6RQ55_9ACTN|nr:hypothetical protein [Actinoallomurus iriomotensis]GLY79738.1 hypothetical protein Airi01_080050 [Actinoallomurus iriomotensis]